MRLRHLQQAFGLMSLMILLGGRTQAARRNEGPVGILGISSETEVLVTRLKDKKSLAICGVPFITGKLDGKEVVLARCGVGKVNAGMTASLLIDHFHPCGILSTGSGGALNDDLVPGDVVYGLKSAQHDCGTVTDKGLEREPTDGIGPRSRNPMFFPADAGLLAAAQKAADTLKLDVVETGQDKHVPKIMGGVLVSGDVFVADKTKNSELHTGLGADVVDMEVAAIAQICWEEHVPFLGIRSVSDNANGETPKNYELFYKLAAQNSARMVEEIITHLDKEEKAANN